MYEIKIAKNITYKYTLKNNKNKYFLIILKDLFL
jgi:hypothetical protein